MEMNGSMEVVTFQMVEGTRREQVLDGIRSLDQFYSGAAGYGGMQAAQDNQTQHWTLVLNWDSPESEKEASAAMVGSERTKGFTQLVVPQTVIKKIYTCYCAL